MEKTNQPRVDAKGHPRTGHRIETTILATARDVRSASNLMLSKLGVTMNEAAVLAYVARTGPQTQTELASALDAGRAVTGLRIDALEAKGLLQRLRDPADRRVWRIVATSAGRAIALEIDQCEASFRDQLRRGFSADERDQLVLLLERVQANLDWIGAERDSGGS